jgi:AcrR family transcriptional regulator
VVTKADSDPKAGATLKSRLSQAERVALSDQRLLEAAIKLIAKNGYEKTSLADIGKEAGYSRGLVNHRFGTKLGLLTELVSNRAASFGLVKLYPAMGDKVGVDALHIAVDVYLKGVMDPFPGVRAFFVLMFESIGPVPEIQPEFIASGRRFRKEIEDRIRRGIEAGVVNNLVDPAAQAILFLGLLRGITIQALIDPEAVDIPRVANELKATLTRMLRP